MAPIRCQYCSRQVEAKTIMRHYAQTGCLQKAAPLSGTRLAARRLRHSKKAPSPSDSTPDSTPVAIATHWHHSTSPPTSMGLDMEEVLPDPMVRLPRVWVEEVPDEGDFPIHRRVTETHPTAGRSMPGMFKTPWEVQSEKERGQKDQPWGEFRTKEDWDFARFLMKSGLSQERIDELLQLEVTRARTQPPFRNKYEFFKKVDTLPRGPQFSCETVTITGDILDAQGMRMTEEVELWLRNPVDCVRDLLGRVTLRDSLVYKPTRVYTGEDRQRRVYEEMWTGDWWWDIQEKLPQGATVAPVILASDKTQLSTFGGDKTAYPVYLTLGNIPKQIRRQPSQRATVLLGYLPVPSLACCSSTTRQLKGYEVFHTCMARLLRPMVSAGNGGVTLLCSDGRKRRVYPLLAAYCADHPEQCVVACSPENRCPKGEIGRDQRGGLDTCRGRDPKATLEALGRVSKHDAGPERRSELENLKLQGIRPVLHPFWENLPHCDIFASLMPDILHQLHKGVFHAHLVTWCDKLMSAGELDRRFMSMASHPDLRHFSKGITTIKQWTGKEQRAMERVFVGAVAEGTNDSRVVVAARSLLDFIYLAQLPCHTSDTLAQMKDALAEFHRSKHVFIENGIWSDFNIPKLHSLVHYVDSIAGYGAADGYNTEYPERFHIEYAKLGYRASNKREYEKQMVVWLERQEAVDRFHSYIGWFLEGQSRLCDAIQTERAENSDDEEELEEDLEVEAVADTTLNYKQTTFRLAKTPPLPGISISTIHHHFGIPDLLSSLNRYIRQLAMSRPYLRIQLASPFEVFNIYKRVTLVVPPPAVGLPFWEDRIRATPAKVVKVLPNLGSWPFFDTVLVKTPPRSRYRYRVARLRLIFELPISVVELRPQPVLAYVEWYTELKATRHPSRMFEVSKVFDRDKRPAGEVIHLSQVVRSCHLIPRWENDLLASLDTPLDNFADFFVNDFLDIHSYLSL